jgi:hypothetical protein
MHKGSGLIYQAYGLTLGSELRLDELMPGSGSIDIYIRHSSIGRTPPFESPRGSMWWNGLSEIFVHYPGVATFQMLEGRDIVIEAVPGCDEQLLRQYLLGPILAGSLRQRGWLLLHASAVAINGRVVAFMGASGWGKSTMAAALHKRGHDLVADDYIAVINDAGRGPHAHPGFPQLKLWPQAAASLGEDPEQMPPLHAAEEKRAHHITAGFAQGALPLGRLYVLQEAETISSQRVTGQQAMLEVVRHAYGTRTMHALAPADHFRRCAALLQWVPLCQLARPRDLGALTEVAELVEREVQSASATQPGRAPGTPGEPAG